MARASSVIGLTMLGAAGVGAATIPFMGSGSTSAPRCATSQFPTQQACQAAGHASCRPDGTMFVPANCSTGSRSYGMNPVYWFGGRGGDTSTVTRSRGPTSGPSSVTTTSRGSGSPTTTTTSPSSSRGGFGTSVRSYGSGSS